MSDQDREKRNAALASLDYVEDGMSIGLGTGSTAAHVVRMLGRRVREGLRLRAVPTSKQTQKQAKEEGIPLVTLDEVPRLDLTIDGTDEFDSNLQLIKGGGGALLREKIVASASDRMIVVADSSKRVANLGAFPLPVEVVPFGRSCVQSRLTEMGCRVALRASGSEGCFVTDEGNWILDCRFDKIDDPKRLASQLDRIPGLVEHGLFVDMADLVLLGVGERVERLERAGVRQF